MYCIVLVGQNGDKNEKAMKMGRNRTVYYKNGQKRSSSILWGIKITSVSEDNLEKPIYPPLPIFLEHIKCGLRIVRI
jgi:hypothetical protein